MENTQRLKAISRTSMIGILVNVLIATVKIVIGLASSSLAIISEGINNATDAGSAMLAFIGSKLAGKKPDKKHPFGHGRMEYISALVIGILILYAGFSLIVDSGKGIFIPAELSVSVLSIFIIAFTAIIKFLLGIYTMFTGKKLDSTTLIAVGLDSRNDAFFSILTIISTTLFIIWHISIDAYVGIVFGFVVLKSGIDTLKETVDDLIGRAGKEELARKLYKEIRSTKGIIYAIDMILHNYGPDFYSGSVNVEIDHDKTIGEIYEVIHGLQLRLMQEYKVTLVFGIYAVDNDHTEVKELRKVINEYIKAHEHILSFHALYLSPETNKIYVDFLVDYDLPDWDATSKDFKSYMKERYPENEVELTIETEFV
ncbi:MAG: cation diffusion facilitator family transporter [Treponema sp.]|nr:cation diffusion facilitator family transporter [Treponema sp.]